MELFRLICALMKFKGEFAFCRLNRFSFECGKMSYMSVLRMLGTVGCLGGKIAEGYFFFSQSMLII